VETGRLVWRFECAGPVFSTPRLVAADAGAGVASLAVGCHGRRVYRVDDAAAGSPTWRSPRCSAAVYASPVVWRRSGTTAHLRPFEYRLGFTGFYWVLMGFKWVLTGFT